MPYHAVEKRHYWRAEDRFNDGRVELYQQLLWQVELPQLVKEVQPLLGLFPHGYYVIVPLQVLRNCGTQVYEWLHCGHSAVHDGERGESRGVSPEVHDHLHCFKRVKLQVVKTAPDSQLLNLLSVKRLVTVLTEADQCGVICKCQELDGGVFRCAVIRVQGEEQWGENTALSSSSADRTVLDENFPSLTTCCLSVRKLVIQWQTVVGTESFVSLFWRMSGMMVLKVELKSTNRILT